MLTSVLALPSSEPTLSLLSLRKSVFLPHTALALAGGEKKWGGKVWPDWCFHDLALTFWDLKTLFQTTFSHKALLWVPHRRLSSTLCCGGSQACGFLVRESSFITVILRQTSLSLNGFFKGSPFGFDMKTKEPLIPFSLVRGGTQHTNSAKILSPITPAL